MTTQEVADRLVALCREGKFEEVYKELYSPEIVSVEPEGAENRIVKGFSALAEKGKKFNEMIEKMHSSTITEPIVAENFFSIGMYMNVDMKGVPGPIDMDEICVYHVKDGKIVLEQFFYTVQEQ